MHFLSLDDALLKTHLVIDIKLNASSNIFFFINIKFPPNELKFKAKFLQNSPGFQSMNIFFRDLFMESWNYRMVCKDYLFLIILLWWGTAPTRPGYYLYKGCLDYYVIWWLLWTITCSLVNISDARVSQ